MPAETISTSGAGGFSSQRIRPMSSLTGRPYLSAQVHFV